MNPLILQGAALVLLLVPTVLISLAYTQDLEPLAPLGMAMVVLGGLVPVVLRYAGSGDEGGDEGGDDQDADDSREDDR